MADQSVHEQVMFDDEVVKLMTVNRNVAFTPRFPDKLLEYGDSYQMGHYVGQSEIVIPLYPDNLHVSLRIG